MSMQLAKLMAHHKGKKLTRHACLALTPDKEYNDGRTKQAYKDECDINKIMARFAVTETITHLNKHQGSYADFSDYDFHEQTRMLTRGREIFDDLPAETRREFGESPAAFFKYVNDPANVNDLHTKIPGLAKPGDQLINVRALDADQERAALAKQSLDVKAQETTTPPAPAVEP